MLLEDMLWKQLSTLNHNATPIKYRAILPLVVCTQLSQYYFNDMLIFIWNIRWEGSLFKYVMKRFFKNPSTRMENDYVVKSVYRNSKLKIKLITVKFKHHVLKIWERYLDIDHYHIFCCNMYVFACPIIARSQCCLFALRANIRICPQISVFTPEFNFQYLHSGLKDYMSKYKERWCIKSDFNQINIFLNIGVKLK